MASKALIQFRERPFQVFFQDFRVFIQGVEVTPWVQGSVTITRTNRDGFGTASFTLDNALDRFIITQQNLAGVWRDTRDRYSEAAKHAIWRYKNGASNVTISRLKELVTSTFSDNLSLVQQSTDAKIQELNRKKNIRLRNINRRDQETNIVEELELIKAAQLTADTLPANDILVDDGSVTTALSEQLADNGLSQPRADEIAQQITTTRRNEVVRAGNKRAAGDDEPREANPDGSKAERSGRHKRQRSIRNPVDLDTGDARWPLQERSAVLHKNDPVRIFIHNPYLEFFEDQQGRQAFWTHGFAGFVDQYPMQVDYVSGQSNLTVQCYDVRALMQKMRVNQNHTLPTLAAEPLFTDRSSIFADLLQPRLWGQAYANLSFEDTIAILTTGQDLGGKGDPSRFGVGDLSLGKIVTYPVTQDPTEAANRETLAEWHTLAINGPDPTPGNIANLEPLSDFDVERIGSETTSDGRYNPLNAQVHFLLPKDGTAARNLTQQTFDAGSEQRDWTNRFQIISDFCARLDYEFTVAPNGDLLFEFPMYDFLPEDFGDWRPLFELDQHLMSGNVKDEGGDIVTALVVTGGISKPQLDPASNAPQSTVYRAVIQSSVMASRVGLTVDQVSLPFTRDPARLRSLGFIEFQKRLASVNEIDQEFGYRPYLMPNRPVYNVVDQRMGLVSSTTNTIQVFQTGATSAVLRYVRQVRDDGTFRFITGADSLPISYRKIFEGDTRSVGNARVGIRSSLEFDGEATALDDAQTTEAITDQDTNDDRPPPAISEARPGTYFALSRDARVVADALSRTTDRFLLTNVPRANGTSFGIRARDPDGARLFSDAERLALAQRAQALNYLLVDTGERFQFQVRRPNQPVLVVRHG